MLDFITALLKPLVDNPSRLEAYSVLLTVLLIIVAALVTFFITRLLTFQIVKIRVHKSKFKFVKMMARHRVQNLIAHLVFASTLWIGGKFILDHHNIEIYIEAVILTKFALIYLFITCVMMVTRTVSSLNGYYEEYFESAKEHPIYSYIRVVNLFIWVVSLILLISVSLHTSPVALLTGIGAASAVFLLVFKDTLLGIVSSIQATALNIVRIGDRISIESSGVDGIVLDISISSVKVQNSDNTTAYIPTYMLTSTIVKNWRTMYESGARRIKRAIYLEVESIKVCDDGLLTKLSQYPLIAKYIKAGNEYTNLTLYRTYLTEFLLNNPRINHEYTTMIRHLESTGIGLPLEIYTYAKVTDISSYEEIQSGIFEHAYSMLSSFELKAYHA